MKWDKYKTALFDFVEVEDDNIVVMARAGSGKTTAIEEIVRRIPKTHRVLVCAFSREIKETLERRVTNRNAKVMSLHGLGYAALIRHVGAPLTLSKYRLSEQVATLVPNTGTTRELRGDILQLCKLCMSNLSTTDAAITATMYEFGLVPKNKDLTNYVVGVIKEVLAWVEQRSIIVSYDEQVYIPAKLGLRTGNYDDVLVDEAQDLTPALFVLVSNALKDGGRLIAVGDDRQSIFRFRGADASSMEKLQKHFSAKTLPLSVTYRCPTEVVRLANTIVPDLEAAPDAPAGVVLPVTEQEFMARVQAPDVVISRTNAAITHYALALIASGKNVRVMGRDISSQLLRLYDQMPKDRTPTEALVNLYEAVRETMRNLQAMQKDDQAEQLHDNFMALQAIVEFSKTHENVRAFIHRLSSDDKDPVNPSQILFMTTHKAKGLEFDRVWMFETTYTLKSVEGENLYYVACTRAKEELYLVRIPRDDGRATISHTEEIKYVFRNPEEN